MLISINAAAGNSKESQQQYIERGFSQNVYDIAQSTYFSPSRRVFEKLITASG
jgi:hypothetical protein